MPVPENAQVIWNYFIAHGLTPNAAAAILGNIEQESGGNPAAGVWPSNYGLIQWTPASSYFSSPPSLTAQLPAIIDYINANGSVADVNSHSPDPATGALYFSEQYERPSAQYANNANREQSAIDTARAAASGNWPQSGTSGPVTTPSGQASVATQTLIDALYADDWAGFVAALGEANRFGAANGEHIIWEAQRDYQRITTFTIFGGR